MRETKEIIDFLNKLPKQSVCAEIGVLRGVFSDLIIKYCNPRFFYLIDSWMEYAAYNKLDRNSREQDYHDKNYDIVKNKYKNKSEIILIKSYSVDASRLFEDCFFDFVYIDANHQYEYVLEDLYSWFPKVKSGGFLCGHDYVNNFKYGVVQAVNAFVDKNNLKINLLTNEKYPSYGIMK